MSDEVSKSGKQKAAESNVKDFHDDLGPFVVAAETTRMAMVFTDAKASGNPIIFANDSFLKLTGYSREEVLGQSFNFLMTLGAEPDALAIIEAAFQEHPGSDHDPEIRCRRKDGSIFWATVFVSPVRDEGGAIVQHFASLIDTTRHKKEEDRLRFLLDELNHRTQNTLATVLAIARQTLDGGEPVRMFEDRVFALSRAQSLLGRTAWNRVGLRHVIDRILEPFGLHDPRMERFKATGDDARLQPKAALSLAMVFHELATNATKYGALSNDAGRIRISWQVELTPEGNRMRLLWQESDGPVVASPGRRGFGSRLIERGLAQELNGEVRLSYDPAGISCQIVMPLPEGDGWSRDESSSRIPGRRVLVVEDEVMVSWILEDMLAELGCKVVGPAARVSQALAMVDEEEIDLAMLDVNLNGEKSFPIADALAARGVPFFFSTGYDLGGIPDRYKVFPVVQKPYELAKLSAALEGLATAKATGD